jgi:hypothetical protein
VLTVVGRGRSRITNNELTVYLLVHQFVEDLSRV